MLEDEYTGPPLQEGSLKSTKEQLQELVELCNKAREHRWTMGKVSWRGHRSESERLQAVKDFNYYLKGYAD